MVTDEDDEVDEKKDVSPVVHQVSCGSPSQDLPKLPRYLLMHHTADMSSLGMGSAAASTRSILE